MLIESRQKPKSASQIIAIENGEPNDSSEVSVFVDGSNAEASQSALPSASKQNGRASGKKQRPTGTK